MSRRFLFLAAVTAVLTFHSIASPASELKASVPSTALGARSTDVIDRAIRALVAREGESRISKLWVFPTGDDNAVFVHYRTAADADAHEPGPTVEHLVLLEMSGERIAKLHDLTMAPSSVVSAVTANEAHATTTASADDMR
jgi:hypothetical protein